MKYPNRFARILLSTSVCLTLAGCFSYSKEEHTAVPTVDTPAVTSSSTTTTTTVPDTNATIERQHTTTTYTTNP
jgi:ABC-type uncharacterized transport system auxiliary subunit